MFETCSKGLKRSKERTVVKEVNKIFVPKSIYVKEEIWRQENQSDGV